MSIDGTAAAEPGISWAHEVAIVGAGLAGLYALYALRRAGFDAHIYEAGSGVGGTWYWNRYPGARCDIESFQYSYSFSDELQQEWSWSERYAGQPEIRRYLDHVADRFALREHITFNCTIAAAHFESDDCHWQLQTDAGLRITARHCIMATGVLSVPRSVTFPGQEQFAGQILHTSNWPEGDVDLAGKRVAIIGTGASGTQAMPLIAEEASEIVLFQRTPNYSIPSPNCPVDDAYERHWKDQYTALRREQFETPGAVLFDVNPKAVADATPEERQAEFERRWNEDGGLNFMRAFSDLSASEESNAIAAEFVREKIRSIVKDPETARKLIPTTYPLDARRLATTDKLFFELFNRKSVKLVSTLEEPITEITASAVVTSSAAYPVDVIVMATGFEAMVGALMKIDLRGTDGQLLRDVWRERPGAYLGLAMAGFPNLFVVNGPGAPGPLSNMFSSAEIEIDWLVDCLVHLREHRIAQFEATDAAQTAWMQHVQELGSKTLMIKAPSSGYFLTNSAGERIFLCYAGGFARYGEELRRIADTGYAGFLAWSVDNCSLVSPIALTA
jgi:cyclohexanone monooxygenase